MTDPADNSILLTGFESFGEFDVNPTELIVKALDGEIIDDITIKGVVLPVVFGKAGDLLINAVDETKPKAVICLGLAGKRHDISLERLAVNLDDADIPDNAGSKPVDSPVVTEGPPACWSTLPVKAILAALKEQGIPASLSMSAGTYVCNHVFYRLMYELQSTPLIPAGFIHLPHPEFLEDKDSEPGLSILTRATRSIVEVTLIKLDNHRKTHIINV